MRNTVIISAVMGILLAFLMVLNKEWGIVLYKVEGPSMEPTIKDGSYVLVWKSAYGLINPFSGKYFFFWRKPKRGEIVYYISPEDGYYLIIKRVAALPGEKVIVDEKGNVYINGKKVFTRKHTTPLKVSLPDDGYFLIGDNKKVSYDSLFVNYVPLELIRGKVIFTF